MFCVTCLMFNVINVANVSCYSYCCLFFIIDVLKVSYVYFKRLYQLKEFCLSPTECPLCEPKYMFSAANSSFHFEHDVARAMGAKL